MATRTPASATHSTIRPTRTLRALTAELEAALTLVRADPAAKSVHKLRTTTRRVEAQLALLRQLPGLPDHAEASDSLLRRLAKVRRAAGSVRDLDVQRDHLRETADFHPAPDDTSGEPAANATDGAKVQKLAGAQRHAAKDLRKLLKRRRTVAEDRLRHTLKRQAPKLSTRLETLLSDLSEIDPALTPDELLNHIRSWYQERLAASLHQDTDSPSTGAIENADQLTPDQLHTVRKLAKLARYLGESAAPAGQPDAAPPRRLADLAARFEALQEAGGHWHDALTLANLARKELGKRDCLTQRLAHTRDHLLQTYQHQLASFHP